MDSVTAAWVEKVDEFEALADPIRWLVLLLSRRSVYTEDVCTPLEATNAREQEIPQTWPICLLLENRRVATVEHPMWHKRGVTFCVGDELGQNALSFDQHLRQALRRRKQTLQLALRGVHRAVTCCQQRQTEFMCY